jgi:hypothetical protein
MKKKKTVKKLVLTARDVKQLTEISTKEMTAMNPAITSEPWCHCVP